MRARYLFPAARHNNSSIGASLAVGRGRLQVDCDSHPGKYFTGTVLIKGDHRLVSTGPYKHLRHPAYTGALVAQLGLGLSSSNWFSLSQSFLPFVAAAVYRMHVEEQAFTESFGEEYNTYSKSTKRLMPKVY